MSRYQSKLYCEAVDADGVRCMVTRGLGLYTNHRKHYGNAVLCQSHLRNPPSEVYRPERDGQGER